MSEKRIRVHERTPVDPHVGWRGADLHVKASDIERVVLEVLRRWTDSAWECYNDGEHPLLLAHLSASVGDIQRAERECPATPGPDSEFVKAVRDQVYVLEERVRSLHEDFHELLDVMKNTSKMVEDEGGGSGPADTDDSEGHPAGKLGVLFNAMSDIDHRLYNTNKLFQSTREQLSELLDENTDDSDLVKAARDDAEYESDLIDWQTDRALSQMDPKTRKEFMAFGSHVTKWVPAKPVRELLEAVEEARPVLKTAWSPIDQPRLDAAFAKVESLLPAEAKERDEGDPLDPTSMAAKRKAVNSIPITIFHQCEKCRSRRTTFHEGLGWLCEEHAP